MTKVLLFGATGHLGRMIVHELKVRRYNFTVVVRNKEKAKSLAGIAPGVITANITQYSELTNICKGHDIVISALGKSVSINDNSKPSFYDIDFLANSAILKSARQYGVKKFVYVSAFQSEFYQHLNYFKVHHNFSEELKQSGIDYSIIKPVAIFSAFIDMIEMAKKGMLFNIGSGNHTTNPIYEGDLSEICVDSISASNSVLEAGGQQVYSRKELVQIIQQSIHPGKKVKSVPLGLVKTLLPIIKIFNRNMFDKFAFFVEVMQHDSIAPQLGKMKFEDYIKRKTALA